MPKYLEPIKRKLSDVLGEKETKGSQSEYSPCKVSGTLIGPSPLRGLSMDNEADVKRIREVLEEHHKKLLRGIQSIPGRLLKAAGVKSKAEAKMIHERYKSLCFDWRPVGGVFVDPMERIAMTELARCRDDAVRTAVFLDHLVQFKTLSKEMNPRRYLRGSCFFGSEKVANYLFEELSLLPSLSDKGKEEYLAYIAASRNNDFFKRFYEKVGRPHHLLSTVATRSNNSVIEYWVNSQASSGSSPK